MLTEISRFGLRVAVLAMIVKSEEEAGVKEK
jgi:hypothetical protein